MNILVHHMELSVARGSEERRVYVATIQQGTVTNDDGDDLPDLAAGVIPFEAFEARAAEYDIDTNSETGWDDLFHLFFAPDPQPLEEEVNDPNFLFNAPTIAHARDAKLGRIRTHLGGQLRGVTGISEHRLLRNDATRITNSGADDPLEFIKQTAPMSAEHIQVRREFTRRRRNIFRTRRSGRHPILMTDLDEVSRRAVLDMSLNRRESAEDLAKRLLGGPLVEVKVPAREGPPSKHL